MKVIDRLSKLDDTNALYMYCECGYCERLSIEELLKSKDYLLSELKQNLICPKCLSHPHTVQILSNVNSKPHSM